VFEIGLAANIIEHLDGDGIEQEAVDGEVAALNVEPRFRGILDAIRMATVRVGSITAIGGNLDGVVVAGSICTISEDGDEYDAKLSTDSIRFWEQAHDFVGRGRCGYVIVCGFPPEQQITHTAADEVGRVAVVTQDPNEASGLLRFF